MDPVPSSSLILYVVLVMLSAFFSSAETALSSVNRVRMIRMAEDGDKAAKRVLSLVDRFDDTLSTILVGNNIVNIGSATVSTAIATSIFSGGTGLLVSTFATTVIILIFGEIYRNRSRKSLRRSIRFSSVESLCSSLKSSNR